MSQISTDPKASQILTFVLGGESFGVHILRVQEIRGWSTVTRIPHSPPHVLGVLNLRGAVVPVFDLRLRFQLPNAEYNALTVIIVVSVVSGASRREVGLVVDGVSDVVDVNEANLRATPDLGAPGATDHISGLLQVGERMVVLLEIDRLIGTGNLPPLSGSADATSVAAA